MFSDMVYRSGKVVVLVNYWFFGCLSVGRNRFLKDNHSSAAYEGGGSGLLKDPRKAAPNKGGPKCVCLLCQRQRTHKQTQNSFLFCVLNKFGSPFMRI